ncbi:hypothetical protein F441_13815 [Phytophthora nicotianae CJ01A1]|uniref:Uncharacterized protein n=3 Tax=Phytophthora nicotianae TaxID=4792 RepID=W2PWS1_PHYN3|nr:hypothetical protein PPTG_23498 [Phytophthora nicotianae INRA-310]ETM40845.1 hypothetical protein L914_13326 [Phytophthora nicotianae]ETN05332.1 hypothetical protein PPTG_23498 [Phytophthora nicotianae INRA-310]ETP10582.1 hypothetical protein F441_13815 [Phytophthora nicotianae CJ01A1]
MHYRHVQGVKPFKDGLSAIDIDHCFFMGKKKSKTPVTYGSVPFVLDALDLSTAKGLGLLRDDTPLNTTDFRVPEYGIAHEKNATLGRTRMRHNKQSSSAAKSLH